MSNFAQKDKRFKDRRGTSRIRRTDIIHFKIENLPFGRVRQDISQTRDLSEKGIFFTIPYPLIPQAALKIELKLPILDKTFELEARIVACEEIGKNRLYGIRAQFINVTENNKELLKKFVQLFSKQEVDRRNKLPKED